MIDQERLNPASGLINDESNGHDQTKKPRRRLAPYVMTGLVALVAAGTAESVHEHQELNAAHTATRQADINGLKATLIDRGISVDHMSFLWAATGTAKAIYSDKAEGKDCRLGFNVYYQDHQESEPALAYKTTTRTKDNITGVIIHHHENTQDIYNAVTWDNFLGSVSSVCNIEGN